MTIDILIRSILIKYSESTQGLTELSLRMKSAKQQSLPNPTFSSSQGKLEEKDDGTSYDPKAVQNITQEWVDEHMKKR